MLKELLTFVLSAVGENLIVSSRDKMLRQELQKKKLSGLQCALGLLVFGEQHAFPLQLS